MAFRKSRELHWTEVPTGLICAATILGVFYGTQSWAPWFIALGLSMTISLVVHELGHAVAAWTSKKGRLLSFRLSRFRIYRHPAGWRFGYVPKAGWFTGGVQIILDDPADVATYRRFILAGPLTTALESVILLAASIYFIARAPDAWIGYILIAMSGFSVNILIGSLFKPMAGHISSDGSQLKLIREGKLIEPLAMGQATILRDSGVDWKDIPDKIIDNWLVQAKEPAILYSARSYAYNKTASLRDFEKAKTFLVPMIDAVEEIAPPNICNINSEGAVFFSIYLPDLDRARQYHAKALAHPEYNKGEHVVANCALAVAEGRTDEAKSYARQALAEIPAEDIWPLTSEWLRKTANSPSEPPAGSSLRDEPVSS